MRTTSLTESFGESNIVETHVPTSPETKRMIDAARFHMIQASAFLVSIAGTRVLDEDVLAAELKHDRASVHLEVFEQEPLPPSYPLYDFDHVFLAPCTLVYSTDSQLGLVQGTPMLTAASLPVSC